MEQRAINDLLYKKDSELKLKKEYTLDIFNAIKDDCVDIMIKKQIECNFEYEQHLYSHEIMGLVIKYKDYEFRSHDVEISDTRGVESAWFYRSALSWYCIQVTRETHRDEFLNNIDAPLFCTLIRQYIISKGFKGSSYVHRYTGNRCNILTFKTTRERLLSVDFSDNSDKDDNIALSILGLCILVGLIITVFVKLSS